MSCPTCSHTLVCLHHEDESSWWYCDRCGTAVRQLANGHVDVYVPKLVERCREYEKLVPMMPDLERGEWRHVGIAESIRCPEDRPEEPK